MTTPEIIGSVRSTYIWAIRLLCDENGIAYTLTETPLRAPEILAIHPFGKMPVLRHDGVELFESKAIATYLDHSFGGLGRSRPTRVGWPSPNNGSRWSIR